LLLLAAALAVALATAGAGSSAPARSHALTHISIRLDFAASPHHAGFYVAKAMGWYKQAGLDVSIGEGQGSATTAQVVAAGSDTFGFIGGDILAKAVASGAPLITVAMPIQDSDTAIIVRQDSGINSIADLAGKTFGDTLTGLGAQLLPAVLKASGVDPSKVHTINLVGFAKFGAFWGHRIDAISAPDFLPTFLSNYGKVPVKIFPYSDAGIPTLGWGIVTRTDLVQSKPNLVRAFVRATLRGYEYAFAHPDQVHAIMAKAVPNYQYQNQDDLDAMKLVTQHTANTKGKPYGWMSIKDWGAALRMLKTYEGFTSIPAATKLYTNEFIAAPAKKPAKK
jgi:NitT/TauT family transport system substrate-binding protein